ncbi:MAG TPA: ribonucleotide-diphosphate reductase subunit beta [Solirubrobacteraceae bacterium]|jgi:hypothetical protein
MATATTSASAAQQIGYEDLYARWERGNWSATEIDFSRDKTDWLEAFSDLERRAALWNYAMFFHGEDSVTDNLSPFIDAAPREEQKYFLATQQVDEARHTVFFRRFMQEVVGRGAGGSTAETLAATTPELTWGFRRTFELLDRVVGELRSAPTRLNLARAVTMYHFMVEASLAQPGQHFIEDYLVARDVMPGFRSGMRNVALDEQRHIAFGVRLLHDLAAEDPEVPEAVADMLREVIPVSTAVFVPPGFDRRYSECFGFTLEDIFEVGTRSLDGKLRAAGLPLESLPGPPPMPTHLSHPDRARRGIAMLEAGILGERTGPAARDPQTMEMLFDGVARGLDVRRAPDGPLTLGWRFADAPDWHVRIEDGTATPAPGVDGADVTVRCAFDDFVDVIGRRSDPRRALLRGKLRIGGSPRALWAARGLLA